MMKGICAIKSLGCFLYWKGVFSAIFCCFAKGTGLLVLVSAEVDASGSTYYGEQSLHFLSSKGESSLVPFGKYKIKIFLRILLPIQNKYR